MGLTDGVANAVTLPATVWLYLGLLATVAVLRFVEVAVSRRHQRTLLGRGASHVAEPHFRWMVALHAGVLIAAALEVVLLRRPFVPVLAIGAGACFVAANVVRWWVIQTLGQHWNVGIMDSARYDVVDSGPYRWVRHPNYAAVFVEMLALPLTHSAWITAGAGAVAHVFVLRARIASEDRMLLSSEAYVRAMGHKPRFFPTRRNAAEGRAPSD
jgi:methyltransferase